MRALKVLVVAMAVIIIVGFTVVIAVIAGRLSRGGAIASASRPFTHAAIEIPRDARIEAMTAGTDRLVLALVLPEGGRQLVVIDLATGARVGTIELRSAP
jgi:Family of unknown function (DUF6476)